MKKVLLMATAFLMLMTTSAIGAVGGDRFVRSIEDEIYKGTRTGQLTYNETQTLYNQLDQYEDKLWEYSNYGNLSRRERNQLIRMEERLIESLDDLKYNRVTVSKERYQNRQRGYYYGNSNRGTYYGNATSTRRPPRATTVPRNNPRRGGTVCPPPRRNW